MLYDGSDMEIKYEGCKEFYFTLIVLDPYPIATYTSGVHVQKFESHSRTSSYRPIIDGLVQWGLMDWITQDAREYFDRALKLKAFL